jgi:hypothetical protein
MGPSPCLDRTGRINCYADALEISDAACIGQRAQMLCKLRSRAASPEPRHRGTPATSTVAGNEKMIDLRAVFPKRPSKVHEHAATVSGQKLTTKAPSAGRNATFNQ